MLISSPLKILISKLMMHKMMGFHFRGFCVDNLIRKKKVLFWYLYSLHFLLAFNHLNKMGEFVLKSSEKLISVTTNN